MDYGTISTDYKEALFAVLRCGLRNEKLSLSENFENIDIEKLLHVAAHENLFPFVFMSLICFQFAGLSVGCYLLNMERAKTKYATVWRWEKGGLHCYGNMRCCNEINYRKRIYKIRGL